MVEITVSVFRNQVVFIYRGSRFYCWDLLASLAFVYVYVEVQLARLPLVMFQNSYYRIMLKAAFSLGTVNRVSSFFEG